MADVTEGKARSVIEMASINPDEKTDLARWLKMVEQLRHAPEWPEELPIEMKQPHLRPAAEPQLRHQAEKARRFRLPRLHHAEQAIEGLRGRSASIAASARTPISALAASARLTGRFDFREERERSSITASG